MSTFPIIHDNDVEELDPSDPAATVCGHCERGWNDDRSTGCTPVPSGRCPFEYDHEYPDDDGDDMPFTPDRTPLGHDAVPDFAITDPLGIGDPLVAIPLKDSDNNRWTIVGWKYIGTNGWAEVDAAGICYATGTAYYPNPNLNPETP